MCVSAYFKGASHSGGVAERVNVCRCRCTVTAVILSWKSADVPLLRRDNEVVPRLLPATDAQRRDSFEERAECSAPRDWNHRSLSCHRSVASAGATICFDIVTFLMSPTRQLIRIEKLPSFPLVLALGDLYYSSPLDCSLPRLLQPIIWHHIIQPSPPLTPAIFSSSASLHPWTSSLLPVVFNLGILTINSGAVLVELLKNLKGERQKRKTWVRKL